MATKASIIAAIEAKVSTYSYYRIGLTHDPIKRKEEWGSSESVTYWAQWPADSLSDAQDIERLFINKGMKGGTGGNLVPSKFVFVYVF
jgi:hypothetical protein